MNSYSFFFSFSFTTDFSLFFFFSLLLHSIFFDLFYISFFPLDPSCSSCSCSSCSCSFYSSWSFFFLIRYHFPFSCAFYLLSFSLLSSFLHILSHPFSPCSHGRYLTTKHSWKGKYKRIFSVGFEWLAFFQFFRSDGVTLTLRSLLSEAVPL